jgi:hypothetical protein
MKKFFSEPYVHFLLIGAVLYLLYSFASINDSRFSEKIITISSFQKEKLKNDFFSKWQRMPNAEELSLLYEEYFFQEVMLKEAVAMQLEKKDNVVRVRLLDKMRKILTSSMTYGEPGEEELLEYYSTHKNFYREAEKISLVHIFVEKEKEALLSELIDTLHRNSTSSCQNTLYGSSPVGPIDKKTLSSDFGNYFAGQIWMLKPRVWFGPVRSKKGVHAVCIIKKTGGKILPFDEAEELVYRDFLHDRELSALRKAYIKLVLPYRLEVE